MRPQVVTITGSFHHQPDSMGLREMLIQQIGDGERQFVLDMADVEFVDSSFLGVLLVMGQQLRRLGGEIRLCRVADEVRAILRLVRLDALVAIDQTLDESIGSFPQ